MKTGLDCTWAVTCTPLYCAIASIVLRGLITTGAVGVAGAMATIGTNTFSMLTVS